MKKIIAYYLPQYYPTKHNNEWWGNGFTEWTNVAKAKRYFPGHYQPHVPADLGFYNLLNDSEVREKQAYLAKEAGLYGFCYYHYWFETGKMELEKPLEKVVSSGSPDFPFCLCWANESWYSKFWSRDSKVASKKLLAEQKYLGEEDNLKHFNYLLATFSDKRYIRIDGRLLFVIYKPLEFESFLDFKNQWNQLAADHGLGGFYFVGYNNDGDEACNKILMAGFDAVNDCRLDEARFKASNQKFLISAFYKLLRVYTHLPNIFSYKKAKKFFVSKIHHQDNVFPTIIPNYDHTPRSGHNGFLFTNSTPELFKSHVNDVFQTVKDKDDNHNYIFLKSWNEWGEGNYMEPDLKYGKGFIYALRQTIEEFDSNNN